MFTSIFIFLYLVKLLLQHYLGMNTHQYYFGHWSSFIEWKEHTVIAKEKAKNQLKEVFFPILVIKLSILIALIYKVWRLDLCHKNDTNNIVRSQIFTHLHTRKSVENYTPAKKSK